jgi:hypothetical protein
LLVEGLLRWWLRSGRYRWSRLHRRLFERKYLKYTLPLADSVANIKALLDQIQWIPDNAWRFFDCVSYPELTWALKKDDCDGFSSLAAALLHNWQPESRPVLITVIVRPVKHSHTVCVFHDLDKLCFFDNNNLRMENCSTFNEIASIISNSTDKLVCWDVVNPFTLKTIEFHKH